MKAVDQIISARWIMTGEANTSPLENHTLVIHQGKIEAILPEDQVAEKYSASSIQKFSTHVIAPGLINTHTHIAMNYFRGLADDLPLMEWLNEHIWPAEKKWVSHEFVRDASLFAMAEMIRGGTTCFNDMYFFLQATAEAADIAGMRAHIGMTVMEFPTAWAKNADEYFARGLEFLEQYRNHPRVTTTLAPHAPYTVSDATFMRVKDIAEQYDLKINCHLHETTDEVNQSLEQFKMRPIERLHKLGLISPRLIAIHMTALENADFDILAKGKPSVVHCPESNMKLASGVCPVTHLQSLGLNVALGTDGAASNNDLDMISEMRSAALLAKVSTRDPQALSAQHAFSLATINGAKALGVDHFTGSLQKGKAADCIAIKLDEIETLPLYHPTSQIVYAASRNQVTDVWVAGKQLLKNRILTTLDESELKKSVHRWQEKLIHQYA
ncbi:MAG: TRZ/ATZ family hydrolase [Gammaproteobacteria bacterium]|nr:TRZ/ATZ family hydrolase [Gammaproteobacteria bacterium]